MKVKKCSTCGVEKEVAEFSKDKSKKDGLRCQCKDCDKVYNEAHKDKKKAWYRANKDKVRAYNEANRDKRNAQSKAYREANRDKERARNKAYREANKDKIKVRNKAYREANKDKIKAYSKTWYKANKDKKTAQNKSWIEANKDKRKAQMKAYQESNKDKIKAYYEANKDKYKTYQEAKKSERIEQLKKIIEPNTDDQWVYVMQCGIYNKIGISNDPLRRVEEIEKETKAPTEIIYLAKPFYGRTKDCEKIIHHELKCFNVPMPYAGSDTTSREWFFGDLDNMVEVVSNYAEVEELENV